MATGVCARPAVNAGVLRRARAVALALIVPLGLLVFWEVMVRLAGTRLIPRPFDVAIMMWDFAFGGVYDDAFSASLPVHLWMSVQRVYGGFLLAAVTAVPLGLLIGRLPLLRAMLDPTISVLRPVPVTAWLPLS
ncbi:MAG: ABC transporter permease, partial [Bradyrhizobiaceae bacterium]|nr:ABC transporter permease [Bradyrhizobiaceae bacterium]